MKIELVAELSREDLLFCLSHVSLPSPSYLNLNTRSDKRVWGTNGITIGRGLALNFKRDSRISVNKAVIRRSYSRCIAGGFSLLVVMKGEGLALPITLSLGIESQLMRKKRS